MSHVIVSQLAAGCRAVGPVLIGAMPSFEFAPGKTVFVGALAILLLWLIAMPRRLIGQADRVPPWWRNVRFWAIVVCLIQMWVYWQFA